MDCFVKEINEKYSSLEAEVDRKLETIKREEQRLEKLCEHAAEKSSARRSAKILSYEEAMTRNANLLKSLDLAKARLRSRTTFSPLEQILAKAIENYKRDLDLSQMHDNPATDDQVQMQASPPTSSWRQ